MEHLCKPGSGVCGLYGNLTVSLKQQSRGVKCASAPVAVTVTEPLLNPLRAAEAQ